MLLAVDSVIPRFIPYRRAFQAHRVPFFCLHTSMHSSHSSPQVWMIISWLPERGHWTFPQHEKRKSAVGEVGTLSEECCKLILKLLKMYSGHMLGFFWPEVGLCNSIYCFPLSPISEWPHVPCGTEFCHAFHSFTPQPVANLLAFTFLEVFFFFPRDIFLF